MSETQKAVVIPSYRVASTLKDAVCTMPDVIDLVVIVGDICTVKKAFDLV